jgi:tetratricopeptide (TPR) repeat protein
VQTDIAVERAYALQFQGNYAQSIAVIREALTQFNPEKEKTPDARRAAMLRRALLLDMFADNTYYSGDAAAAEKPYREELALLRQIETETPYDINATRRVQRAEWALGSMLTELNRPAEGAQMLAHSVAMMDQLLLLEPDDKDLERLASVTSNAYADALVALKRYDEAFPIYERSLAMRRARWDSAPTDWGAARDYAMALGTIADARVAAGQTQRACTAYSDTLAVFDKIRAAGRLTKLDEDNAVRTMKEHRAQHCRQASW